MTYRLKHVAEYAGLRAVCGLLRILPHRAALCVAWLAAQAGLALCWRSRREAHRRIREVFPDRSAAFARRTARLAWRNLFFCAVELIRLDRLDDAWIARHVEGHAEAVERLRRVTADGRGAILAAPHMGSWEIAATLARAAGIPIFLIAARQRNPLTNAYINRLRGRTGIEIVLRDPSLLRNVIRRLRHGDVLGILPDVRARSPELPVPFLGVTANIPGGMALFARQAGVPVYTVIMQRQGWTRHRVVLHPPIEPDPSADREADWLRMTREVFEHVEAAVRAMPEQWFWFNRRWVLEPLNTGDIANP